MRIFLDVTYLPLNPYSTIGNKQSSEVPAAGAGISAIISLGEGNKVAVVVLFGLIPLTKQ